MSDLLNLFLDTDFYVNVLLLATPLIFAALAALISNKAGIVNISIEGTMLVSALSGAIFSSLADNALFGVFMAMVTGILMGYAFAYSVLRLKTHMILVGIAFNLLAAGLVVFVVYTLTGTKSDYASVALAELSIPLLRDIPLIGGILFTELNILVYLAILMVFLMRFFLKKTILGVRIRSVGSNTEAAKSLGINTDRIKTIALMMAGMLAGLGGAFMSCGFMSSFNTGMIAGRGFIGLAAEAIGAGHPVMTALFAVVFGMVNAFALSAQMFESLSIPYELLNTLPYIVTVVGLTVFAVLNKKKKTKAMTRKDD